jgi:hypothetical protein
VGKGKGSQQQPSGVTTTSTNQEPWAAQQPYLQGALLSAGDLYQNWVPQYFPNQTLAPPNQFEQQGNYDLASVGSRLWPYAATPLAFSNGLVQGGYAQTDPALQRLANFADTNAGTGGPGANTLQSFASGSQTNPFLDSVAQSTLASIVPSIQKQFIEGGGLSSPQAAYATSQGATAALAPVLSSAFQQEQQNQLGAAGQLAQNQLAGQGQQISAATGLGNQYATELQRMIQGTALFPQTLQSLLVGPEAERQAGTAQRGLEQASINDAIQRWNYQQTLPYQRLNEFIGEISGNYGGTSQTRNPYYTNTGANALGGGLGGALLGSQLLGDAGLGLVSSGVGAGIGGGLGLLLGLV